MIHTLGCILLQRNQRGITSWSKKQQALTSVGIIILVPTQMRNAFRIVSCASCFSGYYKIETIRNVWDLQQVLMDTAGMLAETVIMHSSH